MKLPPKVGTVSKLSGKRRKPWCAKKFVGWKVDDEKRTSRPIYQSIGTFTKKSDALRALMQESVAPEEKPKAVTFSEVYQEWSAVHYETVSKSSVTNYENCYRHFRYLHDRPIAEIKVKDIEWAIERSDPPRTVRARCVSFLSMIYRYAIAHEYCEKDYSKLVNLKGNSAAQIERKVFSPAEVAELFTRGDVISDITLVGIYTGMRPGELLDLKQSEVDGGFMRIHGSKTKSGLFRDIPIHTDILPIIERNTVKSANFHATRLFVKDDGKPISYQTYYETLSGHTPHDTRHSFVTYARRSGMDSLAVKRIVGHSSNRDVTEDIYTHTDDDFLQREMEKFRVL